MSRKQQIENHARAIHDKTTNFTCEQCGKVFLKNYITPHQVFPLLPFDFNHPQALSSKMQLQIHIAIHLGIKKFKCDQCGKVLSTYFILDNIRYT